MSVQIEIPESVFQLPTPDISRQVLETVALEGYKTRQLTVYQVRKMLGFETRFEVHEFLAEHGVPWVDHSVQELECERRAMEDLIGK